MDDRSTFDHFGLKHGGFRLLQFAPVYTEGSTQSDTIQLTISHHDLEDAPRYNCLSYTWGPPSPTRQILLDGKCFDIRENLWNFLDTCRCAFSNGQVTNESEGEPLDEKNIWNDQKGTWETYRDGTLADFATHYFWIDQLCINQSNSVEKSEQVQLMGTIFGRATTVIAWLGLTAPDSMAAKLYIDRQGPGPLSMDGIRASTPETIQRATELLYRPYWGRLWIVQEVALAKKVVFLCGAWPFTWDDLTKLSGISGANEWTIYFSGALSVASSIRPLHEVILNFHSPVSKDKKFLLCEQRLDKIYGLMGMVTPEQRVIVDYKKSEEEVVRDVVKITISALAKDVTIEDWTSGKAQKPFKTSKDVMEAACTPLDLKPLPETFLHEEWEAALYHKRSIVDKAWRWIMA